MLGKGFGATVRLSPPPRAGEVGRECGSEGADNALVASPLRPAGTSPAYGGGWRLALAGFCLLCLATFPATAQSLTPLPQHPDGLAWPTEGWEEGELSPEVADTLTPIMEDTMQRGLDDKMGVTRAVIIIHEGRLVLEAYADGFGPETKQVSWSMAKSITSALVGRAVQLGLIEDIDAPMPSPFAEDDPRSEITWRQWLTMTDGLDYTEIGAADLATNDVVQMMYGPGRFDVTQYIVDELETTYTPGEVWNYSTAGFHLIGRALQDVTGGFGIDDPEIFERMQKKLGADTAETALRRVGREAIIKKHTAFTLRFMLFDPLGMDAQPEFDTAGTYLGGSLVWASARDFAKFGYLYLRDGIWEGERLLPEGWVDFSRSDPEATEAKVYGAGWWLVPEGEARFPDQAPTTPPYDAFSAQGHEGQTIWVVPSRDLVIVRLGLMDNGGDNWDALYEWNQEIARAFPEKRFASNSDETGGGAPAR